MISVRPASVEDALRIAEIHVAGWREAYRGLIPSEYLESLSVEDRLPTWRDWLRSESSASQVLVAEDEGGVRGFATIVWGEGPAPELAAIYIDPSSYRRGFGSALLDAVVQRVVAAGHPELVLWVHPENARARRFYERAGWRDDEAERVHHLWGVELSERRYRLTFEA